jgi:hypothetical protein
VDVEGCGRLIVHDGYFEGRGILNVHDGLLDFAWFCVCKLGGSLAGKMNISFALLVGAIASALGDRRACVAVV